LAASLFASAAHANYYVVQDVKTKRCYIVDKMPFGDATVTPVGPASFRTWKEAEEGIKKIILCVMK